MQGLICMSKVVPLSVFHVLTVSSMYIIFLFLVVCRCLRMNVDISTLETYKHGVRGVSV